MYIIYSMFTVKPHADSGLSQIRTQYKNLSTKDTTYGSGVIPTIHFEPPKEENLSTQ